MSTVNAFEQVPETETRHAPAAWRSRVPPPPMVVLHQGWFSWYTTERTMEELAEEDRKRRLAGRAR